MKGNYILSKILEDSHRGYCINAEQLKARTKSFAHLCVKLSLSMKWVQLEQHLRGQLIRSATSVAANYRAACVAYSRASFIAKISTVLKEVDESTFWLEFIRDEILLKEHELDAAMQEARELTSIFFATRRTSRKK